MAGTRGPLGACPTPRFSSGHGRQGRECWCGAVAALPYLICKSGRVPCPSGSACLWMGLSRVPGSKAKPLTSCLDRTWWLQLTVFTIHLQSLGSLHTAGHLPRPSLKQGWATMTSKGSPGGMQEGYPPTLGAPCAPLLSPWGRSALGRSGQPNWGLVCDLLACTSCLGLPAPPVRRPEAWPCVSGL